MRNFFAFVLVFFLVINNASIAQNLNDAVKFINYKKPKSAIETLQKLYDADGKNPQTIYWLGQAFILNEEVDKAKNLYQKALKEGVNEPLIWVGMGHVDILETGNINAARQKFEQAYTSTVETKGKNKGKPNPIILNAIGRANATGGSKVGDPLYGIEMLKKAAELETAQADMYTNMGILYQKLGSNYGGEAVKAYNQALVKDAKSAYALWLIGKIYASQGNKDLLEQYFNQAIQADPSFPLSYFSFYQYYQNKDVNLAKEYLDKFIQYADHDCNTDYFYADYLFRAGKYQESLNKAKEMANGECKNISLLPVLFAYNYDRLGDSLLAKDYLLQFLKTAPTEMIEPAHYELAIKVYSKFSGNEALIVQYLEKAIANDTVKANQLAYIKQIADVYAKAKMFREQYDWLTKYYQLKGNGLKEYDYFILSNAALNAGNYENTVALSKEYILNFPDKPQGYTFLAKAAKALDSTSKPGFLIEAYNYQNTYLEKDIQKNKKTLIGNYYELMIYYADKLQDYQKGLEYCDKILALIPEDAEMLNIKKTLEVQLAKKTTTETPGAKTTSSNTPAKK